MGERPSIRIDDHHKDALQRMVENSDADNFSEAFRQTSQAELARRGYLDGSGDSYWAWLLRRVGFAFMYAGLGAVAVFYFLPVAVRLVAVVPLLSGLVCLAGSRAIEVHHNGGVDVPGALRRGSGQ